MARVLCINPWSYDFAAYDMWIEPLGLLTVAAVLREAGHDVMLIDCLDPSPPQRARAALATRRRNSPISSQESIPTAPGNAAAATATERTLLTEP